MCGILYCVYKQSKSCQLPFCASPISTLEFFIYLSPRFLCSVMYVIVEDIVDLYTCTRQSYIILFVVIDMKSTV